MLLNRTVEAFLRHSNGGVSAWGSDICRPTPPAGLHLRRLTTTAGLPGAMRLIAAASLERIFLRGGGVR